MKHEKKMAICKDCNKEISFYAKRCLKCRGKVHSKIIVKLFRLGRYKNRNQCYRTPDWCKKVSKTVKKRWEEGVYTAKRNKLISKANKGKEKVERIKLFCNNKKCKKIFYVLSSFKNRKYCSNKCSVEDTKNTRRKPKIDAETEKIRRRKISQKLKGKLPKNWKQIMRSHKKIQQKRMYNTIKKFFLSAKWEYQVKINKEHRRFLDTAIPELKIDFEYDGMIHLSHKVQRNDKQRDKELHRLGWKIYRFNKDNIHLLVQTIRHIKNER